jgi:lipoate-protein ligase A
VTVPVRRLAGRAGELHAIDPWAPGDHAAVTGAEVWVLTASRPAVVLGSRQGMSTIDLAACDRVGIDVTRRRSGGGMVLVEPQQMTWIDVLVPADVLASMRWCGERWRRALAVVVGFEDAGVAEAASMSCGPLSSLVCFAGVGHGEVVTADGAKLVGISQRRTRDGCRFQCAVHHRWRPDVLAPLLAAGHRADAAALDAVAVATIEATSADDLGRSLAAALDAE